MKTLPTQFYNELEDCAWLRETHLGPKYTNQNLVPKFESFALSGNEDCPEQIELYSEIDPLITETPISTFVLKDNVTRGWIYELKTYKKVN